MKKLVLLFLILFFVNNFVLADSIYDSRGSVVTGKIEGITDGLIQIKSNGNLVTLVRAKPSPIYKDNVLARKRLISRQSIKYSGTIIYVDSTFVKILCEDAKVVIPRYRVKNMELYIP